MFILFKEIKQKYISMKSLKSHYENYLSTLSSNKYGIVMTKLCGYEFFIVLHRSFTLNELYKYIEDETKNKTFQLMFEDKELVMRSDEKFTHYINNKKLKPIYDLPDPVIYRIYLDDGHKH